MTYMFVLLTLAYVPLMMLYAEGTAINDGYFGKLNQYTLGNVGSAKTKCVTVQLGVNNMVL